MRGQTFFEKYSAVELGTTKYVDPALLPNPAPPPAPPFIASPGNRGVPVKMIDVSCDDNAAMPVTISVRTEYDRDPNTGNPATGGPLIGTLLWGVGGAENQIEFNIPSARVPDFMAPTGNFPRSQMVLAGNGLQIYLAGASHVSLTVRNDGSMTPLTNPASTNPIGFVARAKVLANVSPGGSPRGPVERVIQVSTTPDPLGVAPLNFIELTVPPFAKSVRFERYNADLTVAPLTIYFYAFAGSGLQRIVDLGANDEGPIPLSPTTGQIGINNMGAAVCNQLAAIFDVTPT